MKKERLRTIIKNYGRLAVGFSGGTDSAFLLAVAHEVLGDGAVAVTCGDLNFPQRETAAARAFCEERGIRQIFFRADPLSLEAFRENREDRCYHCKRLIFSEMLKITSENGIEHVAEGSNTDDLNDYRPGHLAVRELGISSPLLEAGLSKEEIRILSREMGLKTWNKPSCACLASRFAHGDTITEEKLRTADRAEQILIDLGFEKERVRIHGDLARIEVPEEDIPRLASDEIRSVINKEIGELGFRYVTLDMTGYRTGSMNPDRLEER